MGQNRFIRNIILGIENLMLHKLRSFLTMLGVVFGVGSVVAMLSVGEGASKQALDQIKKLGSNNIIITSIKPIEEETASRSQHTFISIYGLTYEDHERIKESIGAIKEIAPAKIMRKEGYFRERTMELRIVGTVPAWFNLVKRQILAGRVLSFADNETYAPVIVLTEFGARRLLAAENTIGEHLRIGGDHFEIIGIVKSESGKAGNIDIPDKEIDAYIPLNTARSFFGDTAVRITSGSFERERVELHQIIASVSTIEGVEPSAKAIDEMLSRFHRKKEYILSVPLALLKQAKSTKRTFNIVLGSIACISLLVGGIGIMNIMLATVTERIREIGIRRAIGAKKKQIIYQFLIETVVLSTIGGMLGIGVGILIPSIITYFTKMPTIITLNSILLPLSISMTIGVAFGLYPAVRAANVDPIVALRHE